MAVQINNPQDLPFAWTAASEWTIAAGLVATTLPGDARRCLLQFEDGGWWQLGEMVRLPASQTNREWENGGYWRRRRRRKCFPFFFFVLHANQNCVVKQFVGAYSSRLNLFWIPLLLLMFTFLFSLSYSFSLQNTHHTDFLLLIL